MRKCVKNAYIALIFLFLYAPIIIVIIFSFNGIKSRSVFSGFTFKWYGELFKDGFIMNALFNSLILAVLSSIIATLIGTAAALRISKMKKFGRSLTMTLTNIPIVNSEVVTGVSLMILFTSVVGCSLGFGTALIAHVTFNLPYVILNVLPKLKQTDPNLVDAALDLGCTPTQSFFKVILPQIASAIFSAFIMAFSLSFDDFAVSYFTTGSAFETLPIAIYSMTRRRITPKINALFTLIFFFIFLLLLFINIREFRADKVKELNNLNNRRV